MIIKLKHKSPEAYASTSTTGDTTKSSTTSSKSIRIILQSFDVNAIEQAIKTMLRLAKSTHAKVAGPVRLPTKRTSFSILRSPHIDKTAQDQFEQFHYKRILDFHDLSTMTTEALLKIELSPMVRVKIKLI